MRMRPSPLQRVLAEGDKHNECNNAPASETGPLNEREPVKGLLRSAEVDAEKGNKLVEEEAERVENSSAGWGRLTNVEVQVRRHQDRL